MKNLISRIEAVEQKVNPPTKVIVVIVEKDETCEEAKARVLKGYGIEEAPEECCVVTLNLYQRTLL